VESPIPFQRNTEAPGRGGEGGRGVQPTIGIRLLLRMTTSAECPDSLLAEPVVWDPLWIS